MNRFKNLTKSQIKLYINQTHWSIKTIINPNPEKVISEPQLKKILRLSGLNENPSNSQALIDSLNLQLSFIKSLYKDGDKVCVSNNDKLFRLIKSDNRPGPPLTLEMLNDQVKNLESEVDEDKGEIGFKREGYFITK